MQAYHIRGFQQGTEIYLGCVTQHQFVFDIIKLYPHADVLGHDTKLSADMAVTDNTQCFAAGFKRVIGGFLPFTAMCRSVTLWNTAQQHNNLPQYQLSNRTGVGKRRIEHRNGAF